MKRILALLILIFVGSGLLLPIFAFKSCAMEQDVETEEYIQEELNKNDEVSPKDLSIIYVNKEMESIEYLKEKNLFEWYKAYREIICKYRNVLDAPLSVFDFYTEDEVRLICKTVETECYGQSFESKVMVANVIFNRIESSEFSSNVKEVITSPYQFAYWRESISEDTLYAVMYGFEMGDLTNGSLAFHSNEKTERFVGKKYTLTDKESGHHFYK